MSGNNNNNNNSAASGGSNSDGSDQSKGSSSNSNNNKNNSNSKAYNPIEVAQELLDFADQLQESAKEFTSSTAESLKKDKSKLYSSSVYESPMQSFFDDMYCNGPTTLGTTDDLIKYERQVQQQEKKMKNCGILESKLRFTTTSHGRTLDAPHVHNNEHRVIGKLHVNDLPFTTTSHEYQILEQIVGPQRLNNSYLRLTSNHFGSRIENKRHLVSMMDRIISSCQRLASELPTTNPTPTISAMESTTVISGNETTVSSTEFPSTNTSNTTIMNEESNGDNDDMTSPDETMTTTSANIQNQEASDCVSPISSTTSEDTTTDMNPPAELVNPNTTNVDYDTDRTMSQNDDISRMTTATNQKNDESDRKTFSLSNEDDVTSTSTSPSTSDTTTTTATTTTTTTPSV